MATDLEHLQGAWTIASLEVDGQTQPAPAAARIEIKDERFTTLGMGAVYSGRIKLSAEHTPHHLDLHFDSGPEAGNVNHGIYEITRGGWKLCLATRGDARPKEFATQPGSGHALELLTPAPKPAKAAKNSAETSEPAAAPSPATEIEGEWQMLSGVLNGAAMDDATISWVRRSNHANITTVTAGPQTMLKAEFTLDPSHSPAHIDYVIIAGPQKGKPQAGIYRFDGKSLQIRMGAPGAGRPDEFASLKGDGRALTVWKKA